MEPKPVCGEAHTRDWPQLCAVINTQRYPWVKRGTFAGSLYYTWVGPIGINVSIEPGGVKTELVTMQMADVKPRTILNMLAHYEEVREALDADRRAKIRVPAITRHSGTA